VAAGTGAGIAGEPVASDAGFGGAAGAGAFGGIPLATPVQRTDVALKMKLTPHVNEHDRKGKGVGKGVGQ
jgi:hypothetical protein